MKQKEVYKDYISGNELLTIPSVLEAVLTRTISLLTMDVKTRKLTGVSREIMEEALKNLNIASKVLTRKINTMLDILLTTVKETKTLAGSILTTKSVRLQTEYLDAWKMKITLHGMPLDISENYWGGPFCAL